MLGININIDLGPQAVWASFLLLGVFFLHVWGKFRAEWRENSLFRDITKRAESTVRSEHLAPGAQLQVLRVDPQGAIIGHVWTKPEEDDAP